MMNVLSFSCGKDSTAMLFYCLENNIEIDEIIYIQDFFPHKHIKEYIKYIESLVNMKITILKCDTKKILLKNKYYPTVKFPYCKRIKAEIFAKYCKIVYGKYGLNILMGIRKNESYRRAKYDKKGKWFWNKHCRVDYDYYLPIFEIPDTKKFLQERNIKLHPCYKEFGLERMGCRICIYDKNYTQKITEYLDSINLPNFIRKPNS